MVVLKDSNDLSVTHSRISLEFLHLHTTSTMTRSLEPWNVIMTQAASASVFTATVETCMATALRFCARPAPANYLIVDLNRRLFHTISVMATKSKFESLHEMLSPSYSKRADVAQMWFYIAVVRLHPEERRLIHSHWCSRRHRRTVFRLVVSSERQRSERHAGDLTHFQRPVVVCVELASEALRLLRGDGSQQSRYTLSS